MTPQACVESISALFEATAAKFPQRQFLHVPIEACRSYSSEAISRGYADARSRSAAIAAGLEAAGYGAGHRIAVALDNRPEFFEYFLALNALGISIVPLNAAMSVRELSFVLAHSDAALAVTHADHAAHVQASLSPGIPLHVASARPSEFSPAARLPVADSQEAALLYTSGTTGTPKGCILTNEYFLNIGRFYAGLGGYCRFDGTGDRLATPLPVTHMNALAVSFMAMLATGGCLIQLDRFHPSSWWHSLRTSRATAFHYLGVMPAMLLKAPRSATDDFAGVLRFGFGAGVDPRHHAAFEARFGVPLIEAWAMTETGAGAWISANQEPRHVGERCFGRAPRGLDYRIVDDAGKDVAPDSVGELLVRRDGEDPRRGFFSGYYKDARATEQAWTGGWFHTGDLVRVGADATLFFVDRSKNVVRRSGENIAAVEVESALQAHPDVIASAVCPVMDEVRGEEVFAFVVLRAGVAPTLEIAMQLQSHCQQALAYYKAPGYVGFRNDLPQTASQKLARAEIKALGAGAIQAGEAFDLRQFKKRSDRTGASPRGG
jgi:acyl-CoA synthetase (AMP-forming)/AMP-acid ligase II